MQHPLQNWTADLQLRFQYEEDRTVMTERRHTGPLQVQKPLYPEGRSVCHTVILHPPGGMAEGDTVKIDVTQGPDSKTVLTAPAATKWYKSRDKFSSQEVRIRLGERAQLDWLPPENILFEHARANFRFQLELGQDASAIGWETFVFGRRAMGETWAAGALRFNSQFTDTNGLLWSERANLNAASGIRNAAQGLGAFPIAGMVWAVGPNCDQLLAECLSPSLPFGDALRAGVTCLNHRLLIVRGVAQKIEPLRELMVRCWSFLRPAIHGRDPNPLRLWTV
ncbi:MAG: urease accessory protein UreD [Verrucomicrobia bacterium]|nr:urease accessory protein UreD [Verrucomicrobiota bacterium]